MNTSLDRSALKPHVREVLREFEQRSGLRAVRFELQNRPDGEMLILKLAEPSSRFYSFLEDALDAVPSPELFPVNATIRQETPENPLQCAEAHLFLRVLSESLTVGRHSFEDDFFLRYTRSVTGEEDRIVARGNHVVFGRRGSGKSSLLLFALREREMASLPSVWIDMQTYARRTDYRVAADMLKEVLRQLEPFAPNPVMFREVAERIYRIAAPKSELGAEDIKVELPDIRRLLGGIAEKAGSIVFFLDDFHLVGREFQAPLIDLIYSVTRGNRVFIKLSAIETQAALRDPTTNEGFEFPHDAQTIKLDYNLTLPRQAAEHIRKILDNHAAYSGLPSIATLYHDRSILNRLVWVSAGVPRDAISIFSQAMTSSARQGRKSVTVMAVNEAASETTDLKIRDLELDTSGEFDETLRLLDRIREFCVKEQKGNAFLVEREHDHPLYENVLKLIDLRLLHVISEGITVREAGLRSMALILDYGFYVGLKVAKGVRLFNEEFEPPRYEELRGLPTFRGWP